MVRRQKQLENLENICPDIPFSFVVLLSGQKKPNNKTIKRKIIMNNEAPTEYMLLFRGNDWHKGLSLEEMQQAIGQMMAWFKGLTERGIVIAGQPLAPEGKVVSGKNGRTVADGPFAESKEAIGGYFLLRINSLEEAVAIAKQCPILAYGSQVEVRQALHECPLSKEALPERELAGAMA